MRKSPDIFIWKKAPFLRLLIPVLAGIIFQFYSGTEIFYLLVLLIIFLAGFIGFSFLPESVRFRFKAFQGIFLFFAFVFFGALITWQKDIRNRPDWYGKNYNAQGIIVATIGEPPVEKANSFKAEGIAETVVNKSPSRKTTGSFLIYFEKSEAAQKLKYGDRVIFQKQLSNIKGTGNPGAFDYARYAAFHQLYHQVYLKEGQWILLNEKKKNPWQNFIYYSRQNIVNILNKYLGNNNESAIAKALLIGYKIDLDKDLVQAYSNAGVVHLIAISGLHLAVIYGALVWLFAFLPFVKKSRPLKLVLIISGLWFFALLTGASPSVLRAAVMFTFIVAGNAVDKKISVYNSLAGSALFLLCFDPFILWDVGFQLSYLAVLGIVIAQKNISNWFYFKNKYVQNIWQLAAVSLSAQLFTFPLCFYYFHQLPLLFLFSNMIAIPLSTIALWGCLMLVCISPFSTIAVYLGKFVYGCIWLLNYTVLFFDSMPFALWQNVSISLVETILLFVMISGFLFAFMRKNKLALKISLAFSLLYFSMVVYDKFVSLSQKKFVVYNVSRYKATEFIDGRDFTFVGDSIVMENKILNGFHLKPAHILYQLQNSSSFQSPDFRKNFYQFYGLRILMIDTTIHYQSAKRMDLDYIVISKNPRISIEEISNVFNCKKYIFDASNSSRKIDQWKKECEELHLQFHSVTEQGAFVINL